MTIATRTWVFASTVVFVLAAAHSSTGHVQQVFRSRVSAVRLDVLVLDDGRPVPGLSASDFEVFDNGVRQEIDVAWAERTPIDVVFSLDHSESVEGEVLLRLKEAVRASLGAMREGDQAAVLTFSHLMSLDAPMQSDRAALAGAVDRVSASGATSAVDAVYSALSITEGSGRRTLVLLFSDGFDNRSWLTPDEVVRAARESEVVICGVAFAPPVPHRRFRSAESPQPPQLDLLRRLSEATGGEVVTTRRGSDLAPTFVRILDTMRARYLLTYTSSGGERKGWHEVRVRLKGRRGEVVVRPGYLVR
jgi:VWFA-related protein